MPISSSRWYMSRGSIAVARSTVLRVGSPQNAMRAVLVSRRLSGGTMREYLLPSITR
jgi:hypothetical protein